MAKPSEMSKTKQGVSRRTVVKGTAWAVPAVVVATAAPAMAAGASQCLTAVFDANSCKQPGQGQNAYGYKLNVCITNNCNTQVTIKVTKIAANTGNPVILPVNQTVTIAQGGTQCLGPFTYCSNNSANFINVYYQLQTAPGQFGPEQFLQVASPTNACPTNPPLCS